MSYKETAISQAATLYSGISPLGITADEFLRFRLSYVQSSALLGDRFRGQHVAVYSLVSIESRRSCAGRQYIAFAETCTAKLSKEKKNG